MAKYMKLKKLIKKMVKGNLLLKEDSEKLFDLVIAEYEECGDNPNDATMQDLCEIADASGLSQVDDE